jgi:hypothetical protein
MAGMDRSGEGFDDPDAHRLDAWVALPRQVDPAVELAATRIAQRRARLADLLAAVRYDYCAKDFG